MSVAFNTRGDKRGGERSDRRLVDVVLHEERLLVGRLRARDVLALGGLAVGLGPREELLLRRVDVARLALPGLDAGRLERARVREREARLRLPRHLVDLVEVDGGVLLGDAAREEGDAGMAPGTQRSSVRTVSCAISVGSLLSAASTPGTTMAGLRSEPSSMTPFSWIFL